MIVLKSIILSRPCILISVIFTTTMMVVVANDKVFRKQINSDLVKISDFDYYCDALEKSVEFCVRHKIYVDSNMQYGLFLVDVNLRELLKEKRESIPIKIRARLIKLLIKTNEVTKYFHEMVHRQEGDKELAQDIKLSQLFYNRTTWPRPADNFNTDLLQYTKMYSVEKLEEMYGKWDKYTKFIFDEMKYKLSPAQWAILESSSSLTTCQYLHAAAIFLTSTTIPLCLVQSLGKDQLINNKLNGCTANLVMNHIPNLRYQREPVCQIPTFCKELVEKGSEYGYGLLHRLLLMIIARFSRQCIMFSKKADKYKTDTYCMMAFNEAEYIAFYNFGVPDLMFEQMALCGLLGHAQFFRNYWLKSLIQYQTKEGCFSQNFAIGVFNEEQLRQGPDETWKINGPATIMSGQCHGHFTAVAAASLSHVLRYILETYY